MQMARINNGKLWPHAVSGVTPETTRGTRVLHTAVNVPFKNCVVSAWLAISTYRW
jgi:hypothetical protein